MLTIEWLVWNKRSPMSVLPTSFWDVHAVPKICTWNSNAVGHTFQNFSCTIQNFGCTFQNFSLKNFDMSQRVIHSGQLLDDLWI